ncbi:hypothetical protein LCGC14_1970380 [marine sediment metagenome]|uniref:Uncharacterized protein n=1 Tax=marine sediment metagenome TaxID=412755 RepID=A0A0F9I8X9_9ZZZZ
MIKGSKKGGSLLAQQETRCQNCGKYVRPDSPQRAYCAGYELLCRRCDKENAQEK